MKHLVQYSTGAASAEVAVRVVAEQGGPSNVVLVTADTGVEDADNWRFATEAWAWMGKPTWVRLADGRTPMQVGRDERVVPNDRMAVCSKILKRELIRRWMTANYDPADSIVYLGYDWTEEHRLARAVEPWSPWKVACPLMDAPYLEKPALLDLWRERGIEPPALYAEGFGHANCGGACVRGGQAAWELLLRRRPHTYRRWEAEEAMTQQVLERPVTILRDRRGGASRPLSLTEFRERLEATPSLFDGDDWGACDCMGAEIAPVEGGETDGDE